MFYKLLLPLIALESFLLFLIFFWINKSYIKDILSEIDKKTWVFLFFVVISAFILRLVIPPLQHIMYIDEPWYMEAAKNMLQNFSQGDYPKSIGWPFILAISFLLFGVSNWVAIYTSIVLGALTVINVFFLAYIITKNKLISLFSAIVFILLPLHIRWSASAETNVPALFFITLSLFFCFLYYRKQINSLLWLAVFSLAFTALVRPDNCIFIPLFFIGFLFFKIRLPLNKIFLILFVFLILVLPAVLQSFDFNGSINWLEKESLGQIKGSNWSLSNLIYNSVHFGPSIFNEMYMPFFIFILSIIGFIYMLFKQKREVYFLITWFVLYWILFFSSWVQTIGGRDRFFIGFYPLIVIFSGYSLLLLFNLFYKMRLKKQWQNLFMFFLISIIIILLFPYTLKAKGMHDSSCVKLETIIPELAEKDIPSHAIIVANWPTILKSTTDLDVIDINYFLGDYSFQNAAFKSTSLLLFFEDYCCFDFPQSDLCKANCEMMKKNFKLESYKEYSEGDNKYIFYKVIR